MRVLLSHSAWQAVARRIPELHVERAVEHRVAAGSAAHSYELPAIAWRQIIDALLVDSFGPRGGRKGDNPKSLYTAISRIQAAVAMREHHPALRGVSIRGASIEVVPAWGLIGGRWFAQPPGIPDVYAHATPDQGPLRFVVLVPRVLTLSGHQVTEWSAGDPPFESWLHDEASHLEFVS